MSKGTKDRTAAKRIIAQQKAREKRRTVTMWTSMAVVGVLVIAGLVGWSVLAGQESDNAGKLTVPPSAVDEGTAFAFGDGPVKVDVYEDFLCPSCRVFEDTSGATLKQMAAAKRVTVQYHPISILDRLSNGTEYSTRSAAASAAAAEGGKFVEFHKVLFDNQPAEGGDGLTNAKLIELSKSVGLTDAEFADAITGKKYWAWAAKATETASSRGVTGTPTIMINGQKVAEADGSVPSPATLEARVAAAAG